MEGQGPEVFLLSVVLSGHFLIIDSRVTSMALSSHRDAKH